jgi:hypothetical protein
MKTHEQVVAEMMKRPNVHAEVERLEREEMPMLDAILKSHERYSLKELLSNATPKTIQELNEETQWVFDHGTIGREL